MTSTAHPHSAGTCPRCGASLPDAPEGLCPRCLMEEVLRATPTERSAQAVSPPSPEDLAPHFPQLEILSCLGRGGMGVVYKARQKSLDRPVALKLLAPERAGDPAFTERFAREARALAALNHPHIVAVYDFGGAGGFFYLLMEYVDGVNLRELLRARRLTPQEALRIVPPVCEALQCAHDRGIVHRDIKPENLLIDKAGVVKIADFGIAKILDSADAAAPRDESGIGGTWSGGTPGYAAPEQREGTASADHRADIYSLGVVLYEMLTGRLPDADLTPPSRSVRIDVALDEIVLRALDRAPERRYQTAAEFRSTMQTFASSPQSAAGETEGRKPIPVQTAEPIAGSRFASPLAIRLLQVSALGFLAFLGFVPLPGMKFCFGFSGFFGFIGLAILAEIWVRTDVLRRNSGRIAIVAGLLLTLGAVSLAAVRAIRSGKPSTSQEQGSDGSGNSAPATPVPAEAVAIFAPVIDPELGDSTFRMVCTLTKPRHVLLGEVAFVDERYSIAITMTSLGFCLVAPDGEGAVSATWSMDLTGIREGQGDWMLQSVWESPPLRHEGRLRLAGDKPFLVPPRQPDNPEFGPHINLNPEAVAWSAIRTPRSYWVGPGELDTWHKIVALEVRGTAEKVRLGYLRLQVFVSPMLPSAVAEGREPVLRLGDWRKDREVLELIGTGYQTARAQEIELSPDIHQARDRQD